MKEDWEDDDKVMVSDVETMRSLGGRDVEFHEGRDLCLCGGGGGGGSSGGNVGDIDGSGGGGGVDDSGGSMNVGDSGESIVYRSGGGGGGIVYRSGGGGLYRNGWYFDVGWGFHRGGGGRSGTGVGVCCEASPVVCEWVGIFFVSF